MTVGARLFNAKTHTRAIFLPTQGGKPMTATALAHHAIPLRDVFERYHVGWETKNPDLIASLHSEDTVFHVHDGSDAVHGREALRKRCIETFEKFDFSFEMGRQLYGEDHWVFEYTMVLALKEPGGAPF